MIGVDSNVRRKYNGEELRVVEEYGDTLVCRPHTIEEVNTFIFIKTKYVEEFWDTYDEMNINPDNDD